MILLCVSWVLISFGVALCIGAFICAFERRVFRISRLLEGRE